MDEAFAKAQAAYSADRVGRATEARQLFLQSIALFEAVKTGLGTESSSELVDEELHTMRLLVADSVMTEANEACAEAIKCETAGDIARASQLYTASAAGYFEAHPHLKEAPVQQQQLQLQLALVVDKIEALKVQHQAAV